MRLPVSTARLIEGRSDATDATELVNEIRDRVVNQEARYWQTVTTSDATVTAIWTDELPANARMLVWAKFIGGLADGSAGNSYVRSATFRRPGTGAVVLVGAAADIIGTDKEDVAGWDAGFALDASVPGNVYAYVQGAAATEVFWRAHVEALMVPW